MKSKVLKKILAVSMALAMTAGMTACGGKGEEPAPADTPAAKPAESEAPAADAGGSDREQAGEEDFDIPEGKTISFRTRPAKFI